jgi:hypothetical protein
MSPNAEHTLWKVAMLLKRNIQEGVVEAGNLPELAALCEPLTHTERLEVREGLLQLIETLEESIE